MTDLTPEASPPRPRRGKRTKLERAHVRRRLIIALAHGDKSYAQLGRDFSVDESSIREFRDRHPDEIAAYESELENEYAGLWIAKKQDRLAHLQDIVEQLESGELEVADADALKITVDTLRKAAEELGHIPNKMTFVQTQPLEVRLVNVDAEDDV